MLSMRNYQRIAHQKLKAGIHSAITETYLDDEKIYARSYIVTGKDDKGRDIFTNHTILIRYRDIVESRVNNLNFDAYFLAEEQETGNILSPVYLVE